jgi:hypothetical protein
VRACETRAESSNALTGGWRESTPVFDLHGEGQQMLRLTTSQTMKKVLIQAACAAALAVLIGFQGTGLAAQEQLWSIVIHFQYPDGFEFDYVLERGVSTADLRAALADCGRSHRTGSVVQYHCYPVQE